MADSKYIEYDDFVISEPNDDTVKDIDITIVSQPVGQPSTITVSPASSLPATSTVSSSQSSSSPSLSNQLAKPVAVYNSGHVITLDNLKDSYNSNIYMEQCRKFIKRMSTHDTITTLATLPVTGLLSVNGLRTLLVNQLMVGIFNVKNADISMLDYETLSQLLERTDYMHTKSSKVFDLENTLALIFTIWFTAKPDASKEKFVESFEKLWYPLLSPHSIAKIVRCPQFKKVEKELAPTIVDLYTNTLIPSDLTKSKQRSQCHLQEKEVMEGSIMTTPELGGLKKGDLIDARDKDGIWYVGTVMDISGNCIFVSFSGWSLKFNEWIKFSSGRIAKCGTFTNGELHTLDSNIKCICHKCIDKGYMKPLNALDTLDALYALGGLGLGGGLGGSLGGSLGGLAGLNFSSLSSLGGLGGSGSLGSLGGGYSGLYGPTGGGLSGYGPSGGLSGYGPSGGYGAGGGGGGLSGSGTSGGGGGGLSGSGTIGGFYSSLYGFGSGGAGSTSGTGSTSGAGTTNQYDEIMEEVD